MGIKHTNIRPLRICLLSYRSNPHSGGQGVYVKNLSKALKGLGHHVEIVSGPPDLCMDDHIPVHRPACLDLYNPDDLFRIPSLKELANPINLVEWLSVCTMGFPEPFTFGLRAFFFLKDNFRTYDIVHDNQSLSYGLLAIKRFVPMLATIHHPITVDRDMAIKAASSLWKKAKAWRWYSFVGMQKRVARRIPRIITVSEAAKQDISREFGVNEDKFKVVPNGIDVEVFHPIQGVERKGSRVIVTNSADIPLKGLSYLLRAIHKVARRRKIELVVVGEPRKNGNVQRVIRQLGIGDIVTFTGRINEAEFVRQYAMASVAVVPSLYEGFGLPAGEAMACAVPVISTTGGALPEVVGDAGILVPPGDSEALAREITALLDNPERARKLGEAGYRRVLQNFTWQRAAELTVDAYLEVINDYRRSQ